MDACIRPIPPRKSHVVERHKMYIQALEAVGVEVNLARFKQRALRCDSGGRHFIRHEEKETDVAIAVRLLESFATDEADTVVVVSGDTDLLPAIRAARSSSPRRRSASDFPITG